MTKRNEALTLIYRSVAHRATISETVFVQALQDWEVTPVYDGGEVIGGVLSKDNEIHIGVERPFHFSGRRYIREVLQKTIDKYGFAITTVQPQNSGGLRFCKRLGFVEIGERGGNILLRCDRSNYK